MRLGYWVGIGVAGLLVLGILDYQNITKNIPSPPITREQVISDVHQALTQNGEVPVHMQTLHFNTKDGNGFALVRYQCNGRTSLAEIVVSKNGYEMGSSSFKPDKKEPIRSFGSSGNGWEFVAGLVIGHPEVKSAVIIFSNGTAAGVPVRNGYYWYEHQMPSSTTNVHYLKVIGITSTGGILTKQ